MLFNKRNDEIIEEEEDEEKNNNTLTHIYKINIGLHQLEYSHVYECI